jgi:replicative DNA helicase
MSIELLILRHVMHDEDYARKVIPFLKERYFQTGAERIVFGEIEKFIQEYNTIPSREALTIEIDSRKGIHEEEYKNIVELVSTLDAPEKTDKEWLIDSTEKFCQERAVYNAIMDSIQILDGKNQNHTTNSIPTILSEALAVSFDSHIGHDFLEDYVSRYESYHRVEERIPFDLEYLNKITRGGLPKKTLNIIMSGTGVGKTLSMCHFAAGHLTLGKNVLYITMEMSEEKIAERIDANLLNVPLQELEELPREAYEKKVARVQAKTTGKLIIKEYPTASAHAGHFRHLLNELNLKRSFKPDVIFIDYLNICMSARIKPGSNVNSYSYIKSIAEELRGLAVEKNVPIISATQTTRTGYSNSDPGLEDTSESFGLPATADFMIALISTEELQEMNQIMVKQLKNRYNDPGLNRRFVIGVDRPKMRLYDLEQSAQAGVMNEDKPIMDKTGFGERQKEDDQMKWATKTMGKKDFSKWKF